MLNMPRRLDICSEIGWPDTPYIIVSVNSLATQFQMVLLERTHGKFQAALIWKDNDGRKRKSAKRAAESATSCVSPLRHCPRLAISVDLLFYSWRCNGSK